MANAIVGSGVVLADRQRHRSSAGHWLRDLPGRVSAAIVSATLVRFTADVLNGVPSIVIGIAVYALVVLRSSIFRRSRAESRWAS